jgi:hypothetical protein
MKQYCLLPAILGLLTHAYAVEALHYNLLPGSTITPYNYGGGPTGATEPLTGHLDWVTFLPAPSATILSFEAVDLDLHSESFTLVLDRTPVNDVLSPVHTDSQYTLLSEVADLTGFDISMGYVSSISPGTYYGPATRPVVLRFPDVRISPIGGGTWRAVLDLVLAMDGITINAAPSFSKGSDILVPENRGPQVVSGWATDISPGPAGEAGQTLTFMVTTDNGPLFSVPPAIAPDGTLTFMTAASQTGVALVTVVLKDNGGTAYGGQDTSPSQTFTISVLLPNVAPSFTEGPSLMRLENCGPQVVPGWATHMSSGPVSEAGQTLAFEVTTDSEALFSAPPAVGPDGTLTFTPASNRTGVALVTVVLKDNGGTAYGGRDTSPPQRFTITVLSPCQAVEQLAREVRQTDLPHFSKQPLVATLEAAVHAFERGNWVAGVSLLRAFQHEVQTLLARVHPALAQHWISQAQDIINLFPRPFRPPQPPHRQG